MYTDFTVTLFQENLSQKTALKFLLTVTEYYYYKSVPSIDSIKLMTNNDAKMGQNGESSDCATF